MTRSEWTPERDRWLIELVYKKLTLTEIAAQMDITRGAVAGRVHRMNSKHPESRWLHITGGVMKPVSNPRGHKERAPRKPSVQRKRAARSQYPAVAPIIHIETPSYAPYKTIVELDAGDCRYPVNNGDPYLFCARQKAADGSYCPTHAKLCMNPVTRYR